MKDFSSPLLKWYRQNGRDLQWRHTKDPYLIWLSEIILQQTRVAQGTAYYLHFAQKYPTPKALASASEDEVLKSWQGLGYYSRARNLHAAAKSMNGKFPTTYEGVRALKGVGDYTAAAICSIAYNMPYAVVDGNVYRVLSRFFNIETPIDTTEGKKEFTALAQQILPPQYAGEYNQAIMDFGATVCTPQNPLCQKCPLSKKCVSYKKNRQHLLPIKAKTTKVSERFFHYIYVEQGDFMWLHKRAGGDIWQGLYELPLVETDNDKQPVCAWAKKIFPVGKPVKHILSHQIIRARIYKVTLPPSHATPKEFLRVKKTDFPKYAIPRLVQKLVEQL